jgi:hypothetical protein
VSRNGYPNILLHTLTAKKEKYSSMHMNSTSMVLVFWMEGAWRDDSGRNDGFLLKM